MKQMINDSINFYREKIAETILEAFFKKELIVESSCSYTDPIGTERFSIQEEDEMHCCEFIEFFSIVKYPDWYSELFDLYEYNVEGAYGGIIYDEMNDNPYEELFKEAEKQCKYIVNEADKPDNFLEYCKWYVSYLNDLAEEYDCSDYEKDKNFILTLILDAKNNGVDVEPLIDSTFSRASGVELCMKRQIKEELRKH